MPTDLVAVTERNARLRREARANDLVLLGSLILFLANLVLILAEPGIARAMIPLAQ